MSQWIWSGRTALLWGTVFFALLFVPAVVVQYRRWGDWNLKRLAGTFAVSLYATALVTYTWLPLPPRDAAWCAENARQADLRPLHLIGDIARAAGRETSWVGVLTNMTVLQVVFNVVLFVPLGVIVRRYFGRGLVTTVAAGFAVTLLIEATQFTGLWGLYPCAYRVADVDDLIANTTGAVIGALIAPAVLWWMPDARVLATRRTDPRPVTALRRWTGQLIDVVLLTALMLVLTIAAVVLGYALGWGVDSTPVRIVQGVEAVLAWVVMCVLPPARHLAASPGQSAVWLTPVWRDADGRPRHGSLPRRLARANVTALPVLLWMLLADERTAGVSALVWLAIGAASVVGVAFTRTHRSLSGWLTGAEFVDIRTLKGDPAVQQDWGGLNAPGGPGSSSEPGDPDRTGGDSAGAAPSRGESIGTGGAGAAVAPGGSGTR